MNRLIPLTTSIVLSIFLVTAVHAASDKETANSKPDPKGNPAVKSYHDKDKQRNDNKKRAQKVRQQQIDNDASSNRSQQPSK